MKIAALLGGAMLAFAAAAAGQMNFSDDPEAGTLTLRDGRTPVLVYRYGDQVKDGLDPKFIRSSYIHPLHGLDGRVLTEDFPADHPHHRGLFWAWPVVKTRGVVTSNWEARSPPLRQIFTRWTLRAASLGSAELGVENAWVLDGRETVAREYVLLRTSLAESGERRLTVEIVLEAVGGPLELQGAPDQGKGYGGLCFRGASFFKGAAIRAEKEILEADVVNTPLRWAGLAAKEAELLIEVLPEHPGGPQIPWLIRTSYGGVLNPSWPGLSPIVLEPGEPVRLAYLVRVRGGIPK
ncbi:MAG: hypothetical protein FJY82_08590 [Candidatus Aminicenantes bacterium]|nr:hypothetical protein [Candidatus Aminicenantes bacterium]